MVKYSHPANPARAKAMHGFRSSGAAGPHKDRRSKRSRTREASIRRAVKDFS